MNVVVFLDQRFVRTPDGLVWTEGPCPYSFFLRYLAVFEGVKLVARVRDNKETRLHWRRVCGRGMSFRAVPHYVGPWEYLTRARELRRTARSAIGAKDAVILRVPSHVAACAEGTLRGAGRPYGVEVLGDPQEAFAAGSLKHPLRPLFQRWFRLRLESQCRGASAAAYVTAEALQRRYPANRRSFVTHYSSVELPEESFASQPRSAAGNENSLRLLTVASMESLYKGHDVLIDAIAACAQGGLDVHAVFVGEGRRRRGFEDRALKAGMAQRITFRGALPAGEAVRAELDKADVFVLPSRTEGLPRAMLEAMARCLPCIASSVGGIPELLPPQDTLPAGDSRALAKKINEVLADPARMASMSRRNLEKAREYHEDILRERRNAYYDHLRRRTESWLNKNRALALR